MPVKLLPLFITHAQSRWKRFRFFFRTPAEKRVHDTHKERDANVERCESAGVKHDEPARVVRLKPKQAPSRWIFTIDEAYTTRQTQEYTQLTGT